jgi:hypothetical protein
MSINAGGSPSFPSISFIPGQQEGAGRIPGPLVEADQSERYLRSTIFLVIRVSPAQNRQK